MNQLKRWCLGCACVLALASCDKEKSWLHDPASPDKIDTPLNLTRNDYENLTRTNEDPTVTLKAKEAGAPPIPDLAPILAAPQPPKLGETKLVSIAVTDDIPLKDVLQELARLANVDMEVDAGIAGGVSFRASDRPFNEVIERIAGLAGLRYKIDGGILRVERDTPYVEIYPIDFINIDRTSSSSVNISTNVLSGGGGGGGGGLNTGSSSSISSKSDSDFWKQFEEGIKQILSYQPVSMMSAGAAPESAAPAAAAAPGQPAAAPKPAAAAAPAAPAKAGAAAAGAPGQSFYILNRQGATLTVSATQRQQEMLKRFVAQMERNASAQVLIEAKIVEVTLDRAFQSGINWSKFGTDRLGLTANFGGVTGGGLGVITAKVKDVTSKNIDLNAVVSLAESFGTTRTLSSPRLHAINNQQAVLTFAENQVYFQVKVQRDQTVTTTAPQTLLTVNSEIKTIPIGIIMMIQPSINLDSQEVTLNVRPTLSRVTGSVEDPAVAFLISQASQQGTAVNIKSVVPVVEVRELDSIVKLKSGEVMVIGGLMEDKAENGDTQLPYFGDVPIFGNLFRGIDRKNGTKELVIFIRATIVDSRGNAPPADQGLYNKFTSDPRPLKFGN